MTTLEIVFIGMIVLILLISIIYIVWLKKAQGKVQRQNNEQTEVQRQDIEELTKYIKAQKQKTEEEQRFKNLIKEDLKQKLENFKQTKEELQEKLKKQLDEKEWRSLDSILKGLDKGGVGIYILHNETKDKYYVGQAKQIFKRVREHFDIEDLAMDRLAGDQFEVKFLTANELDADYRLDHIEKTGIEIFNADRTGYNKTTGNL